MKPACTWKTTRSHARGRRRLSKQQEYFVGKEVRRPEKFSRLSLSVPGPVAVRTAATTRSPLRPLFSNRRAGKTSQRRQKKRRARERRIKIVPSLPARGLFVENMHFCERFKFPGVLLRSEGLRTETVILSNNCFLRGRGFIQAKVTNKERLRPEIKTRMMLGAGKTVCFRVARPS